jgi:hypothetical protein
MEQNPWEASSYSVSEEITRNLCNEKVHYRDHKSPPAVSILSEMKAVNTLSSYFLHPF